MCIRDRVAGAQRRERDQTRKKLKEGTREKSQQPGGGRYLSVNKKGTGGRKERVKRSNSRGGGGDLSANTNNEKHLVGFCTIIWRVYWTYVR